VPFHRSAVMSSKRALFAASNSLTSLFATGPGPEASLYPASFRSIYSSGVHSVLSRSKTTSDGMTAEAGSESHAKAPSPAILSAARRAVWRVPCLPGTRVSVARSTLQSSGEA